MTGIAQPKLSERLALEIRKLIVDRRLKPGDRFLSENTLIGMYGVGRSTIREAIKLLVAENVVEIHHGKGTFICERMGVNSDPMGLKYADQTRLLLSLFETRLIVEPRMTFLATKRATAGDLSRLEGIPAPPRALFSLPWMSIFIRPWQTARKTRCFAVSCPASATPFGRDATKRRTISLATRRPWPATGKFFWPSGNGGRKKPQRKW